MLSAKILSTVTTTTSDTTTTVEETQDLIDRAVQWSGLTEKFVSVAMGAIAFGLLVLVGVWISSKINANKRGYYR